MISRKLFIRNRALTETVIWRKSWFDGNQDFTEIVISRKPWFHGNREFTENRHFTEIVNSRKLWIHGNRDFTEIVISRKSCFHGKYDFTNFSSQSKVISRNFRNFYTVIIRSLKTQCGNVSFLPFWFYVKPIVENMYRILKAPIFTVLDTLNFAILQIWALKKRTISPKSNSKPSKNAKNDIFDGFNPPEYDFT